MSDDLRVKGNNHPISIDPVCEEMFQFFRRMARNEVTYAEIIDAFGPAIGPDLAKSFSQPPTETELWVKCNGQWVPIEQSRAWIAYENKQFVEKFQRNELTVKEIADKIKLELAKGVKKIDIAKAFGRSPAFISQYITLLDLPDPIANAFDKERIKDVTLVNELVIALKKAPQAVTEWLDDEHQEITRATVKRLREFIEGTNKGKEKMPTAKLELKEKTSLNLPVAKRVYSTIDKKIAKEKHTDPVTVKKVITKVRHNDRPARLILGHSPSADGYIWLKYEDDGHEFEANLLDVRLTGVIEG